MNKVKDGVVVAENFFGMVDGKLQKIPVGTQYGKQPEKAEEVLEVATPPKEDGRESALREFIHEQTGKRPGGRTSIDKLEERAKELGYEEE